MLRKKIFKVFYFIIFIFLFIILGFYYFLLTRQGARFFSHMVIKQAIPSQEQIIEDITGNLMQGLMLQNIEIKEPKGFPAGSAILIQSFNARIESWGLQGLVVEVDNVRLKMPYSEPIVVFGILKQAVLDFNIFANTIDLQEVLSFFTRPLPKQLSGALGNVDIEIKGTLDAIHIGGNLRVNRIVKGHFVLMDTPINIDLALKKEDGHYTPQGNINILTGTLQTKTVKLQVQESKFSFKDSFLNPSLWINTTTVIKDTQINLKLRGTKSNPELRLTSNPPLSESKLMLMLATGKSWESLDKLADEGKFSVEFTGDLVDFLLFRGQGGKIIERMGIKDISVLYDENIKGFGLKKGVFENLEVGYEIKRTTIDGTTFNVDQRVGGELKVHKNISVAVDKEIKQTQEEGGDLTNEDAKANDKVLLKFKKEF